MRVITDELMASCSFLREVLLCENRNQYLEKIKNDRFLRDKYLRFLSIHSEWSKKTENLLMDTVNGEISEKNFLKLREYAKDCVKKYDNAFLAVEKEAEKIRNGSDSNVAAIAGAYVFHDAELETFRINSDYEVYLAVLNNVGSQLYEIQFRNTSVINETNISFCQGADIIYTELWELADKTYEFNLHLYNYIIRDFINLKFAFNKVMVKIIPYSEE